jgi:chromosome segregation ATPase
MLAKADRLAADGEYHSAIVAYDAFLARYADDAKAPRARVSRDAVASVLMTRGEIARLQQELVRAREELAKRDGELAKRDGELAKRDGELARLRQEAERLRADLERLKQIDLQMEKRK